MDAGLIDTILFDMVHSSLPRSLSLLVLDRVDDDDEEEEEEESSKTNAMG